MPQSIAHSDVVELVELMLVLVFICIPTLCLQTAKALASLHIYTGLPETSFPDTGTKNKCPGSFGYSLLLVIIYLA